MTGSQGQKRPHLKEVQAESRPLSPPRKKPPRLCRCGLDGGSHHAVIIDRQAKKNIKDQTALVIIDDAVPYSSIGRVEDTGNKEKEGEKKERGHNGEGKGSEERVEVAKCSSREIYAKKFFLSHQDELGFFQFVEHDVEDFFSRKNKDFSTKKIKIILERLPEEIDCRWIVHRKKRHIDLKFPVGNPDLLVLGEFISQFQQVEIIVKHRIDNFSDGGSSTSVEETANVNGKWTNNDEQQVLRNIKSTFSKHNFVFMFFDELSDKMKERLQLQILYLELSASAVAQKEVYDVEMPRESENSENRAPAPTDDSILTYSQESLESTPTRRPSTSSNPMSTSSFPSLVSTSPSSFTPASSEKITSSKTAGPSTDQSSTSNKSLEVKAPHRVVDLSQHCREKLHFDRVKDDKKKSSNHTYALVVFRSDRCEQCVVVSFRNCNYRDVELFSQALVADDSTSVEIENKHCEQIIDDFIRSNIVGEHFGNEVSGAGSSTWKLLVIMTKVPCTLNKFQCFEFFMESNKERCWSKWFQEVKVVVWNESFIDNLRYYQRGTVDKINRSLLEASGQGGAYRAVFLKDLTPEDRSVIEGVVRACDPEMKAHDDRQCRLLEDVRNEIAERLSRASSARKSLSFADMEPTR